VAGRETWFHLPPLHLAFDLGRAPTTLVSVPNVFLSHAHLDHGAGLAYWCSQRRLLRLPGGIPLEGGFPLIMNGEIVGAIGVSGDSGDHDSICAQEGANTLK
jgi:hypothetical protein